MSLLAVRDLHVTLPTPGGPLTILSDIAFDLGAGETLGVVGESGSGKSMLALALIGLLPPGAVVAGTMRFAGTELATADEAAWRRVRGAGIAMIFQEPATALNPAIPVGMQIAEALRLDGMDASVARAEALRLLGRVRLAGAAHRADAFPHELSGGQRQRVAIAIALARRPRLLLADEPTTALDVTVQAEILDLLAELVAEDGMSLLLVSHDLGVVSRATRRTLVLYAGTRFEMGPTATLVTDPANPYTSGLLAAVPRRRPPVEGRRARLPAIPGTVPRLDGLPAGCRFSSRCPRVVPLCREAEPAFGEFAPGRGSRCLFVPGAPS